MNNKQQIKNHNLGKTKDGTTLFIVLNNPQ